MKYFLATDHAGVELAGFIKDFLIKREIKVECFLPQESERVDYPDYAHKLCEAILKNQDSRGILVCGTGIGMCISANRFKGIRAALCTDSYMAKMTRLHNDANVLCLGARLSGIGEVESILEAFLDTEFEGGRHLQRIQKIELEGN
ncbi:MULTISPECIES: ribose 5-phosphate isomerase B [unclassified Helicobacter]|uniref:ribose 5-phosphate isomerase B n=1 Tax=unclassified Helicobacter TaxID=2593540 RepID=UPI000CF0386F|nr:MULTISPECIES: ribose 5-phosphate isomerase B [unclassified Helicobacter]